MSVSNNATNRQTGVATVNNFHSHLRAASGQWHNYNDQTDQHGYYSGVGSPEGVVLADTGSYYSDTGVGATGIYYKTTDTVNTGWVLLSTGASAFTSVNIQSFTTGGGGTYTPTPGMLYCIVELIGGGGAGGGAVLITVPGNGSVGGGGGAGEYARGTFSAATIGASQTITLGSAGTAGLGVAGGNGGTTSIGVLMTAAGGLGGTTSAEGLSVGADGGAGGNGGAGGQFRCDGFNGGNGDYFPASTSGRSGLGGDSQFSRGGQQRMGVTGGGNGFTGGGVLNIGGAGGSGALNNSVIVARSGGNGVPGLAIITEFIA